MRQWSDETRNEDEVKHSLKVQHVKDKFSKFENWNVKERNGGCRQIQNPSELDASGWGSVAAWSHTTSHSRRDIDIWWQGQNRQPGKNADQVLPRTRWQTWRKLQRTDQEKQHVQLHKQDVFGPPQIFFHLLMKKLHLDCATRNKQQQQQQKPNKMLVLFNCLIGPMENFISVRIVPPFAIICACVCCFRWHRETAPWSW